LKKNFANLCRVKEEIVSLSGLLTSHEVFFTFSRSPNERKFVSVRVRESGKCDPSAMRGWVTLSSDKERRVDRGWQVVPSFVTRHFFYYRYAYIHAKCTWEMIFVLHAEEINMRNRRDHRDKLKCYRPRSRFRSGKHSLLKMWLTRSHTWLHFDPRFSYKLMNAIIVIFHLLNSRL